MQQSSLEPASTRAFAGVLDDHDLEALDRAVEDLRRAVGFRRVWHVNSTARGGGVAEMLSGLLPFLAGSGLDVGWLVIDGSDDFFVVTKRLHNRLHETPGDGHGLGDRERAVYNANLRREGEAVLDTVSSGDLVVLHDPQTAGLARELVRRGAHVVWRCHVGVDAPGPLARSAWDFLRADVDAAQARIFSRPAYVWEGLADACIVRPCINVLSEKNRSLTDGEQRRLLGALGLAPGDAAQVRSIEDAPAGAGARLVVQVSRWDSLKDPVGVVRAFASDRRLREASHLVLAGPEVDGVDDDPESRAVFEAVCRARESLPGAIRRNVHLLCLPMADLDENARLVNALQRRADVVVQKSLAEGFGLTVAEAMWKQRPVVASGVGGIQDQIVDGESGLLLRDPRSAAEFANAVGALLVDAPAATRIGRAAHRRVCDHFLPGHHFAAEARVYARALSPVS